VQATPALHFSVMATDRLEKSGLNRAWITASAALPLEWRIEGLTRNAERPESERWRAWAGGPQGETVEGKGEGPSGALNAPTRELLTLRGSISG